MRIKSSISQLGNLLFLSLSACIVVSAIGFSSILHDLPHSILIRSLPGSLASAPEGAIGKYQPSPGPVIHEAVSSVSGYTETASTARDSGDEATSEKNFGSAKAMAATDDSDGSEEARRHIPSVSEVDAMMAVARAGTANKGVVRPIAGLMVWVFTSVLVL
ncbi:hypothetical protein BJX99DRAFT_175333 [Aspergillus californicus]